MYNRPAQLSLTNKNSADMWVKFRFDGGPELKYTVAAYSSKTYSIPNYSKTVQCTSAGAIKELHSVYAKLRTWSLFNSIAGASSEAFDLFRIASV
jgi:hypothetical protein